MPRTESKQRATTKTDGGRHELAQVVLTTAESKRLIAKAVARPDVVRQAAEDGIVAPHPSSSTYFVVEKITGAKPKTNYWVCGAVTPKGMCVEMAMVLGAGYAPKEVSADPGDLRATCIVDHGKLAPEEALSSLFDRMTSSDAYIKGVNAWTSRETWAYSSAISERSLHSVRPQEEGLQRHLPGRPGEAHTTDNTGSREGGEADQVQLRHGNARRSVPGRRGITVSELQAIEILSGTRAIPIASGGLGGAVGALTLMIKGQDHRVRQAVEFVEQSKGARFPQLRLCNCEDCSVPHCRFP
jgi:hypothetical protein